MNRAASGKSFLSPELEAALNAQLNREFYSSYLYLSLAAHFEAANLIGCAQWMRVQAQEEYTHAMKFFNYILDRGGRIALRPVDGPPSQDGSALAIFSMALEQERQIRDRIHDLYEHAERERDHATSTFLQWFVTEQVEEEKLIDQIIGTLELIGEEKAALYMFDRELGARPAAPAEA